MKAQCHKPPLSRDFYYLLHFNCGRLLVTSQYHSWNKRFFYHYIHCKECATHRDRQNLNQKGAKFSRNLTHVGRSARVDSALWMFFWFHPLVHTVMCCGTLTSTFCSNFDRITASTLRPCTSTTYSTKLRVYTIHYTVLSVCTVHYALFTRKLLQ